MRSLVAVVAICVTGWSAAVGQVPNGPADKMPIALGLKDLDDVAENRVEPESLRPEPAPIKADAVAPTTVTVELVRQAVPKKDGGPSADELSDQFARWWMLKARVNYQRILDDNLFARALSTQPGSPAWLLAWSVARAVGPPDKLLEKLQDEGEELTARGKLFPTLSKEVNSRRFTLGTSILKATGSPEVALQFAKANLALSELNLDNKPERWEKVASEYVKTEQMINDVLTPQLAKEIVEADALYSKSLTAEQAKITQGVELLLHKRFVAEQATQTQSTARLIEKATPQQLLDSRKKVRETFRKVLDDNPELLTDLRHGATVASASETEELKAARKQTQSRTQDATK